MNRRQFLKTASIAATAGITGVAGCTGPDGGGDVAETTALEETPTGTPAETPATTQAAGTTQANETTQATETTQNGTAQNGTAQNGTTQNGTATGTTGAGGGGQVATHYRLGGEVAGWRGREPQQIADATNPTLNLEAGKTYKVTWENLDGAPHNFVIQDSSGNSLASTETMSNEGETLSLTFTASEEMAQYVCTIHPTTMVGDIQFGG